MVKVWSYKPPLWGSQVHPIDVLTPVYATNSTPRRNSRKGGEIVCLAQRTSSSISERGSSHNDMIASVVGYSAVNHLDVSRRKFFCSERMRAIANSFETTTYPSECAQTWILCHCHVLISLRRPLSKWKTVQLHTLPICLAIIRVSWMFDSRD